MIRRPPRSTRTAHSFPTRRSSDLYAAHQGPTDGSTILFGSVGPLAIAPHLMSLPYDPVKDLAPITMGVNFPNVLVVNSSLPIKTFAQFIEYAKANPGKIDFASTGHGSAPHMAGALPTGTESGRERE